MTFLIVLLALAAGIALGALLVAAPARARVAAAETALEYERAQAGERTAALSDALDAVAHRALEANRRQLVDLARDTLTTATTAAKNDLDRSKTAVETLVAPVAETLGKVETRLRELEVAREGAYRGLLAQVGEMRQTTLALQKDTQSLVTALRKPQVRGSWGEMHLRRAVEAAGMAQHCDFAEQLTALGDSRLRPDMVVRLAGGRNVVVDAKVPLVAFLDAIEAPDESAREGHLRTHARHLRTHVESLAAKSYWERFTPTPEFVVLFVPQEAVLDAALGHDKDLYDYAIARRVLLTTPTSLIAMLLTVAHTWKQEALAENAREVCDLGRELYKRLSAMGGNVERLGKALNRAVGAYNDTVGSLERSVLPQARRFRDLRISDAPLDEVPALADDTRLLTAPELVESAMRDRPVALADPDPVTPTLDAELRRAAGLA